MRDRCLQCVETVIQRQQRVLAEGDDHRLLRGREHGRAHGLGAHWRIVDKGAFTPLGDGLLIKTVLGG